MASEYCRPAASDGQAVRRPRLRRLLSALALVAATGLVLLAALSSLPTACGSSAAAGSSNTGVTPSPDATRPFAAASRLYQEGFDAEAKDQIIAILSASPEAPLPESVSGLVGRATWRVNAWHWARRNWLALLAGVVVIGIVARWAVVSSRKRLLIEEFKVGKSDLPIGESLAAYVQQQIAQLNDPGDGASLRLISSVPEDVKIPSELADTGGPGAFAAAISHFIRPQVYTLSGSLHPAGPRGVGLTLLLRGPRGDLINNVTLWSETYRVGTADKVHSVGDHTVTGTGRGDGVEPDHYSLAPAAAAWTLWRWVDPTPDSPARPLGTSSWESLALFACAADAPHRAPARDLYLQALDEDEENRGALLNLAVLDASAFRYEKAEERLQRLEEVLDRGAQVRGAERDAIDAVRIRADYAFAGVYLNWFACSVCSRRAKCPMPSSKVPRVPDPSDRRLRALAEKHSGRLLLRALVIGREGPRRRSEFLVRLARRAEPRAMAMLAASASGSEVKVTATEAGLTPGYAFPGRGDAVRGSLIHDLLDGMPSRVLEERLTADKPWFSRTSKTHYDLACFYALSGRPDAARESLRRALRTRPSLFAEANKDPVFCSVREADPGEWAAVPRDIT